MLLMVVRPSIVTSLSVAFVHFLQMQAIHQGICSTAWTNHLVVGGWCLYGNIVVGKRLEWSPHQNDVFRQVCGDARISRRDIHCRLGQTAWWLVVGILRCSRGVRKTPTD
jgi:hypothetical protein